MIAVSDTSPLCYLILIGEAELLPSLFGQVVLPRITNAVDRLRGTNIRYSPALLKAALERSGRK